MSAATPRVRVSARLRLALSYAVFLVAAGAVVLIAVYVVLYYVPNYPLAPAIPGDSPNLQIGSRGDILKAVLGFSALALVALALIGIIGGWFLAGWILAPLRRINEAAQIVATGDLQHRIALTGRNDEFRQVADNFDHMLDRLRDAFEVQERFAANASHELRTPLAVTATMLDVALRNPDEQDYPVLLERLRITNDRAVALTAALLRLADANAIVATAEPVGIADIVRAAIKENADEADRRDVTITSQLGAATVIGDAGLLTQLVTNLVQNAVRHSGSGGRAFVSITSDHQLRTVALCIESTGSLFDAETAARLAEPFLRGAGRIAGGVAGNGLGLALVDRIAAVHGGSLAIVPRAAGGLEVTVTLPADGR
ncbi:HAMP domain-containing sensor histidine kinase [Conyzicola nivalis]|uniref:histidine kinase n=1 Tax=Conyzicola nivalis TaxID=1477021 RepID=A0A916SNK7_9MICO|nr:HAMP domain-containing sensor histidine kinase [Conyzicola nivalis]GGB07813.1 two-component sensor histidine kinase [Conyzicola nivalis]